MIWSYSLQDLDQVGGDDIECLGRGLIHEQEEEVSGPCHH